jgi:preprotein translocase subunit SecA
MTHLPDDLVQRKHNYAIVDEVSADWWRGLLWFISGPVPQEIVMNSMNWNQNWKSSSITASISKWFYLKQKKLLKEGKLKKRSLALRAYRSLPKKTKLLSFKWRRNQTITSKNGEPIHGR